MRYSNALLYGCCTVIASLSPNAPATPFDSYSKLVRPEGIEPPALRSGGRPSPVRKSPFVFAE